MGRALAKTAIWVRSMLALVAFSGIMGFLCRVVYQSFLLGWGLLD